MAKPDQHSRRDFLQGRAAVRSLAAKTQDLLDSASELLDGNLPTGPVAHVFASRQAMACEFAIQYHESDAQLADDSLEAFDLIEAVEDQLTIYRDHSEVVEINNLAAEHPLEVDAELFDLLQLCQQLHRDTGGAFDITSGPLSRTWGFLQRAGRLPEEAEIASALANVDSNKVLLDAGQRSIRFAKAGIEINFNSIGKGYALDRASALLAKAGHNDYLWHGGGSSVLARGINRAGSNNGWTLGLRHPFQPERRLAEFYLRDRALATAGGATQFFEHEGRTYSHILDPRTGWPATGVLSATVLAPTAAQADGLATAFFVMNVETVAEYCSHHPEVAAVLVCPAETSPGFVLHQFGLQTRDFKTLASQS